MKRIILISLILSVFLLFNNNNFIFGVGSGGGGKYLPSSKLQDLENLKSEQTKTVLPNKYKNITCVNLKNMKERIKCRLSKNETELKKEPFLPEECRILSGIEKIECIKLYQSFYKCFEKRTNLESCVSNIIGLNKNKSCLQQKGKNLTKCQQENRNKLLNYIKFHLYQLSYRIEEVRNINQNKLDEIVNFIYLIEESKKKLNKTNDIDSILAKIEEKWEELIKKLNLPSDFDKKSNLTKLRDKLKSN